MTQKLQVRIRFNTHYKEGDASTKEWRVLVNGFENFCNHVQVNCPSQTSKDFIEGVGQKWHISCIASHVEYVKDAEGNFPENFFREIVIS